jgi:DNA-directed RNA polymerase specialized sigma24 family protein
MKTSVETSVETEEYDKPECGKPLTDLYRLYHTGGLPKDRLEGLIFQHLLGSFEQFRIFSGNRDRWDDFISWLYPRLARAVDLYREQGSSFDAYITRMVNSAAKEYRCREADHNVTEYVCWRAKAEENLLLDSEPEYLDGNKNASIPDDINPRQILFLLLKSYFFVSEDFVKRVSLAIGMNAGMVQNVIDELRQLRSKKEADFMNFRERIHCQHYRCLAYQKRMQNAQPGTEYHERMMYRFQRAQKRFLSMKKRLRGMRMSASNRMIADVLGIPRGTVDSSLFAIKNRLAQKNETNQDKEP